MFKKILSLILVAIMLALFCACNTNDTPDATDGPTEAPTGDATNPGNDVNVPEANVPEGATLLSGENRYRVVYASGLKKISYPVYNALVDNDKLADGVVGYYSMVTDSSKDEGAPEILIGATNRELSAKAASMLKSYRDYVILTEGNKIAIYAENEAYLEQAVADFISKISVMDEYHLLYTNEKEYLVEYVAPPTVPLDGSQVMFIGNSFIYYGNCVNYALDDADRHVLDEGYFYQICKANGEDVEVYNYTWMAKDLDWIYDNKLSKEDPAFFEQFDYVFISEAGSNNSEIVTILNKITALFPDTTNFAYMIHSHHHSSNHNHIFNAVQNDLPEMGFQVVDWGGLVYDVWTGVVDVPGAELDYNKLTFIKDNTSVSTNPDDANVGAGRPSDSFHENPLAGYITAQMAYCVATNKSAVGQDYSFCNDPSIHKFFDFEEFISSHYDAESPTNFPEVFESEADMNGIQQLIDLYVSKYPSNNE